MGLSSLFGASQANAVFRPNGGTGGTFTNPMVSESSSSPSSGFGVRGIAGLVGSAARMGVSYLDAKREQGQIEEEAKLQAYLSKQATAAERSRLRHLAGSARASMGTSGVAMNTGSALQVQLANERAVELGAQRAGMGQRVRAGLLGQRAGRVVSNRMIGAANSATQTLLKSFLETRR